MNPRLYTYREWLRLTPWQQGYVLYMQAELPGSELKGVKNKHPEYPASASKHEEFNAGERAAMLEAQDGED